ncbi:MAG TPA: helical backbone metal receptor [Balneolales bacterium]|nr:helical backbone metal receptor [Balneolales bacterium]
MSIKFSGRIVSLVPSLTELLIDLGLGEQIVGRTRFCILPEDKVGDIPIIGGTKNPNLDKIKALKPDMIVANYEENRKEDIAQLQSGFRVFLTDIRSISDAFQSIRDIGNLFGVSTQTQDLIRQIEQLFEERPTLKPIPTLYLIWRDPWMGVGRDTYVNDVMQHWELSNVLHSDDRYPVIDPENRTFDRPELILLSSEPFPFKTKHSVELRSNFADAHIEFVDGKWFSWYGSRMLPSFRALNDWRKQV